MTLFSGGSADFFQKGENDRWRGILTSEDLDLYEQAISRRLSQSCARWLRHGSRAYMEPTQADD